MKQKISSMFSILLVVVTMVFIGLSFVPFAVSGELPPPFEKIKIMTSKCELDTDGNHVWKRAVVINGKQMVYLMLYSPKDVLVAIGRQDGPYFVAVILEEKKREYTVEFYAYGRLSRQLTLPEAGACEMAYKIFRELVANKLI